MFIARLGTRLTIFFLVVMAAGMAVMGLLMSYFQTAGAMAVALFLVLLISLPLGIRLARWVTQPILELQEVAKTMLKEKRPLIALGQGDDELADLGQLLNKLATRSQERIHALEAERAKVGAILDNMVEGVIALDVQSRILFMNPGARETFGLGGEQLEGQSLLEVVRHQGLADLVDQAQSREREGAYRGEIKLEFPIHRVLDVNSMPAPFGASSKGILLVFHDITELRRLELVRAEFVANVSHELRTPLTAIKGYLETLLDETPAEPETHRRFLEVANTHAERLGRLVDDLLHLSNIETGKVILRLGPILLAAFIGEVSAMFEKEAAHKGVVLVNRIPSDLQVHADRDRLTQIFVNVVDNALKYTPEGGVITFTAQLESDGLVAVQVQDTGQGIPAIALPRLTERFYRVDKARSREQGGTGLGLAIVKHLVQLHGGRLRIESELDKGTTVHVALPVG